MVKDKALGSPSGGSTHRSDIWNDVQKHCVYIRELTLRCVCAWAGNFGFDLLLHFIYEKQRSQGHRQSGQIWTKSSELLHQGLSRTAWKMQKHHSASFCRWDHNHSLTGEGPWLLAFLIILFSSYPSLEFGHQELWKSRTDQTTEVGSLKQDLVGGWIPVHSTVPQLTWIRLCALIFWIKMLTQELMAQWLGICLLNAGDMG